MVIGHCAVRDRELQLCAGQWEAVVQYLLVNTAGRKQSLADEGTSSAAMLHRQDIEGPLRGTSHHGAASKASPERGPDEEGLAGMLMLY